MHQDDELVPSSLVLVLVVRSGLVIDNDTIGFVIIVSSEPSSVIIEGTWRLRPVVGVKLITTTDGRRRRKEWVSGESHKERAGTAVLRWLMRRKFFFRRKVYSAL
jgi:hypothetical protein